MSTESKVNGEITGDSLANSPPRPQRKLRLNRRGFHLSNHPLMKLLSDKSDQEKPNVNGYNDNTENKTDSSQKKISLHSVKNSTSDSTTKSKESSTIINLKKSSSSSNGSRNGNSSASEVSTSGDPPPKKKHKPITWP